MCFSLSEAVTVGGCVFIASGQERAKAWLAFRASVTVALVRGGFK